MHAGKMEAAIDNLFICWELSTCKCRYRKNLRHLIPWSFGYTEVQWTLPVLRPCGAAILWLLPTTGSLSYGTAIPIEFTQIKMELDRR